MDKRTRLIGLLALALSMSLQIHALEQGAPDATPFHWNGLEIVTNDFESVERIRSIAAFPDNSILPVSAPKLKSTCSDVRAALPSSSVVCFSLFGGESNGIARAWYVIEVDIPKREAMTCVSLVPAMSEDLVALAEEWIADISRAIASAALADEFVNEDHYLDYKLPRLSEFAAKAHAVVKDRGRELEATASSCDGRAREAAFYLMSFAGDPTRFLGLAAVHILDDDPGAANAATRFLTVFENYIDEKSVPRITEAACTSLDGGLTARNKSLMLLSKLKKPLQLDARCKARIRNIARTSRADLVAGPANELLGADSDR